MLYAGTGEHKVARIVRLGMRGDSAQAKACGSEDTLASRRRTLYSSVHEMD